MYELLPAISMRSLCEYKMLGHDVKPTNRQKTIILLKYLVIMIIWAIVLGIFVASLHTIANSYPPPRLGE